MYAPYGATMSCSELPPAQPTADRVPSGRRVLVVDDSAFMRRLVSDVVQATGEFEVVGTAKDGHDALRQIATLHPDLITLDVDMPGLDGLAALEFIMRDYPRPVIMLSAGGSDGGADATLRALERGAVDFVRKPSGAISLDLENVGEQLRQALRTAATVSVSAHAILSAGHQPVTARALRLDALPGKRGAPAHIVCIAASTGGPAALARILPALPAWHDTAVLVVQHMPPGFTASFAKRLNGVCALTVQEAAQGDTLRAGHVYIAPGGWHMRVQGTRETPRLALGDDPAMWGVRPAADPTFVSASAMYGAACVGVVLTGMGRDGADGLYSIRRAGGRGVVQNAASSIVPSMPEAARRVAGADGIASLDDMATVIVAEVAQLTRVTVDATTLALRESA